MKLFGGKKEMAAKKTYEQEIKELEAKYGKTTEPKKESIETKTEEPQLDMSPYLAYFKEKYGAIGFTGEIALNNQLLFAIFCELVEIKTGNEEAREVIMKEKGK